jgi:hypothetical protein
LSATDPANTEQTVALDLPPRGEWLQSSRLPQLVDLAHDRPHFLFIA